MVESREEPTDIMETSNGDGADGGGALGINRELMGPGKTDEPGGCDRAAMTTTRGGTEVPEAEVELWRRRAEVKPEGGWSRRSGETEHSSWLTSLWHRRTEV